MCKIIGIGNALVDILALLSDEKILSDINLAKGGMTLIDSEMQEKVDEIMTHLSPSRATGGSAGNAILALSGLNAEAGFIGSVGKDDFGDFFLTNCKRMNIEPRILIKNEHTGVANTFITPDGERTFATYLGAAALMTSADITPELFDGYDYLHIEGYLVQNHDLIEAVCCTAKQCGLKLSIDLGSYNIVREDNAFFHHLVADYMDIVFANEEESQAFTGIDDPAESLSVISQMCETCIVKLGSKGASAMNRGGERVVVPARKVNVIDTTAAGDFFAGGFLYAYSRGVSLDKCLRVGAHLSENVIQVVGTRLEEDVWQNIRDFVNEVMR